MGVFVHESENWFQSLCPGWLQEAFQGRVISRLTTIAWPAKSPDMSCLDFWFWGVAMEEVRKSRPSTLTELKARACRAVAGASFEGSLQKILKGLDH